MNPWLTLLLTSSVLYWGVFAALLRRRRWSIAGLLVGILHVLLAMLLAVAPFRSFLDPDYSGFSLGLLRFEGRAATLPSALILLWALLAAWTAVGVGRGRPMLLIAVGDLLLGLNLAIPVLSASHTANIQLGEFLTISGVAALMIMLSLLVGAPLVSSLWAWRRASAVAHDP